MIKYDRQETVIKKIIFRFHDSHLSGGMSCIKLTHAIPDSTKVVLNPQRECQIGPGLY